MESIHALHILFFSICKQISYIDLAQPFNPTLPDPGQRENINLNLFSHFFVVHQKGF